MYDTYVFFYEHQFLTYREYKHGRLTVTVQHDVLLLAITYGIVGRLMSATDLRLEYPCDGLSLSGILSILGAIKPTRKTEERGGEWQEKRKRCISFWV